jgi:alkylation response protein AidB-like acyl-CoA dehydrogenase
VNVATAAWTSELDDTEIGDLLTTLAQVAHDAIPRDPGSVRAHRDNGDGFDRDLWRRFADLGWLSLLVPESAGGAGADERAAAIIARALGSAGRLEPFVAAGVIVPLWLAGLDSQPAADLLSPVMAGEILAAPAWQAGSGGPDPKSLPITATLRTDGVILDGTAHWVPVHQPDTFVVAARGDGETFLVRVDAGTHGVRVHPQPMADGTCWARLQLAGAHLPATALLGRGEPGEATLAVGVDVGVVVVAAELLGLIEHMLELTVDYLGTRKQFGQPIGSFQALQHKAVDMWVQERLTEAALTAALRRRVAADLRTGAIAASSAKARASSAALQVGGQAVQLHGAIGFTDEYELAHLVNRALVLAAWLGNAATHVRRHARLAAEQEAR